jgi:hypothetical protein
MGRKSTTHLPKRWSLKNTSQPLTDKKEGGERKKMKGRVLRARQEDGGGVEALARAKKDWGGE